MPDSSTSPIWFPGTLDQQMATHERLVYWVVRQQWRADLPFADALHAGRVGLWQALRHYDPTRGTRFSSYAVPAIRHAVWAAVTRDRSSVVAGTADALADPDAAEAWAAALDRRAVHAALHTLVGALPPRLRQVIVAHYGLDATAPQSFAQIGAILGVSRQRVQQLHVMALLWLAHPDHARALRRLVERQRRGDYQQARACQNQWARTKRAAAQGRVGARLWPR